MYMATATTKIPFSNIQQEHTNTNTKYSACFLCKVLLTSMKTQLEIFLAELFIKCLSKLLAHFNHRL